MTLSLDDPAPDTRTTTELLRIAVDGDAGGLGDDRAAVRTRRRRDDHHLPAPGGRRPRRDAADVAAHAREPPADPRARGARRLAEDDGPPRVPPDPRRPAAGRAAARDHRVPGHGRGRRTDGRRHRPGPVPARPAGDAARAVATRCSTRCSRTTRPGTPSSRRPPASRSAASGRRAHGRCAGCGGCSRRGQGVRVERCSTALACTRLCTPILAKIRATWTLTVFSLM